MALGTFARLTSWISERGGSAHSSDLRQAGFTARELAAAVACGELARIQRSWLVVTDCSAHRQFAASVGGRVTCQTGATERGWWTPLGAGDTHVWVPRSASRISASQLITHRALGPVPMPRFATTDAPLNVLFQVARCLPRADALAVWESARTALAQGLHLSH